MKQGKSMPLPSFREPPVVEVILGVQFEELLPLSTAQIGLLWSKYRKAFPVTQDHPLLDPVVEAIGDEVPGVKFTLELANRPPRVWFVSSDDEHVIQIQQDRFVVNWRKRDGKPYPRFPHVLELFSTSFGELLRFVDDEKLGKITPNQCEVTYVNRMPAGKGWTKPGELEKVISPWSGRFSDDFLPAPDILRVQNVFTMRDETPEPLGRLHTDIQTVRTGNGQNAMILNITARGRPITQDTAGILSFFHLGREWVVRTFVSYTTPNMHSIWGRDE